ncbi:MAG: exodeoxyribonuclease VII small subunit [Candidatus Marinimicrobia bacterium]|jgi:exodeoxyribonuclease VII small subunit|nr:exodeoxyribonuclease VII small subunit [Candidatus Neomarinimicrobiota bacterium]MDD4961734.1 exodeoxyribonuclease VII small subunit [Candidatus Neomarinimicrobiota bacterium]MDD5710403.1 exodeoxyribonuclease VII small subunit [Candidatus Neomarinimicrobiota bacterium]
MSKEKSFEAAMSELENIVREIEDEATPLEKVLDLYERGTELSRYCQNILNKTREKLEQIRSEDPEKEQ